METIIASLLTAVMSIIAGKAQQNKTLQDQKELMTLQNQMNNQNWEKAMNYQTPENQVERLQMAGMTKGGALASLAGNAGTGQISGVSGANAPAFDNNIAGILNSIVDKVTTARNMEADTNLKNSESTRTKVLLDAEKDNLEAITNELNQRARLTEEQIEYQQVLNKWADQKEQAEIEKLIEEKKKITQEISNMKEEEKKMVWENFFRTEMGIDPNSSIMNMLVTATLSGKEGVIWDTFEKAVNNIFDKASKVLNEKIKTPLNGFITDKKTNFTERLKNFNEKREAERREKAKKRAEEKEKRIKNKVEKVVNKYEYNKNRGLKKYLY